MAWYFNSKEGSFLVGVSTNPDFVLIPDRPVPYDDYIFDGINWVLKTAPIPTVDELKKIGLPYTLNSVVYQVPLDKDAQDTIVAITVQSLAGAFVSTNLEFSNGVKMPILLADLLPFVTWFSIERNKFFI